MSSTLIHGVKDSWESKCKRCGKCCYHKVHYVNEGVYELLPTHCKYLNPISKMCRVYDTRFEIKPECLKLTEENVKTLDWLPKDCGLRG